MSSVRLICVGKPHHGKTWRLERLRTEFVLRDHRDEVVTAFSVKEQEDRIQLPDDEDAEGTVAIHDKDGNCWFFEAEESAVSSLRSQMLLARPEESLGALGGYSGTLLAE